MKKIIFYILSSFLLINNLYAAQNIQISATIASPSPAAQLFFIVDDPDVGKKTPYVMSLKPGQNFQMFSVEGNHYQIIQWSIQAPNLNFTICEPSELIDNQSLVITINGQIAENNLRCTSRKTAALIQLASAKSTPVTANPSEVTQSSSNDHSKTGYASIANYLTALNKCKKGDFHADFETQKIDYAILGAKSGVCDVAITTGNMKPLLCHFTDNDIALLASPTVIQQYTNGVVDSSPNSLNTRIMNARCKSI